MNDREKFLFDLQGFLVVPEFLTHSEVDELNAAVDANMEKCGKDDNHNLGNSKTLVGTHRRGMFTGMLTWPKPWCQPFREIIVHKKAIPYLNAIHGRGWRLDHSPFILTADMDTEGLILHGSTNHQFSARHTTSIPMGRCDAAWSFFNINSLMWKKETAGFV